MKRYEVEYYRCCECGFVQTEEPYWLEEAYSDAITATDTGLVSRNLSLARITQSVIRICFDPAARFLDYAGGYGLLVRLMRNAGYDFRWYDMYCHNLFAQGFEAVALEEPYELVTAFEVLEHMYSPLEGLREIAARSRNILLTTEIISQSPPQPTAWWYYGLDHGQHVSFFTQTSLQCMARKLSLHFYTNGSSVHLLTENKLSQAMFSALTRYPVAVILSTLLRRKSLLMSDFELLRRSRGKAGS